MLATRQIDPSPGRQPIAGPAWCAAKPASVRPGAALRRRVALGGVAAAAAMILALAAGAVPVASAASAAAAEADPPASPAATAAAAADPSDLPVDLAAIRERFEERHHVGVRNALSLDQVFAAIGDGDADGLSVDFRAVTTLTDGTTIDPARIYGSAWAGPYPFEADETEFDAKRFRTRSRVRSGATTLRVAQLLDEDNSEGWTRRGQLCVRFELRLELPGMDRDLGTYDTFVFFERTDEGFRALPSIVEGPFVGLLHSGDPTRIVVALRTSEPIVARVSLDDGRTFESPAAALRHEIALTGLEPAHDYRYRVQIGASTTASHGFRTAPEPGGGGAVRFAYTGDSRQGRGGGMLAFMGLNHRTLTQLLALAVVEDVDFALFGGDLVNGYTSSQLDFETQLRGWKQAVAGFWSSRPIYPCIGNHDTLLRVYRSREHGRVSLDRWPYATSSAEAVFAREFLNPSNGPLPSDPRRPAYEENVYALQYGQVLAIAFNNNYWAADHSLEYGGSPEGYILQDQLAWLEEELERAEHDPTVRYVILYAQEPVFPMGGHVGDAMWYDGDNTVRARTYRDGRVVPEALGLIEVRNQLVRLAGRYAKVAAVLGSDEHVYHRVLIDATVPVGDPARDDRDGNGRIDWPAESCSPLEDLAHPTWYLVSGGAGAPYYSEEPNPWATHWQHAGDTARFYRYSSQENVMIFHADRAGIGVRVLNPHGELIDEVENLMAVKKRSFLDRWLDRR
ncbi:MAG: metallophosphoesterase [Candidatus Eiseniibacteriota bacterium]|jgi:3',5'-cyclic AMP phosphodiesterase CpdA